MLTNNLLRLCLCALGLAVVALADDAAAAAPTNDDGQPVMDQELLDAAVAHAEKSSDYSEELLVKIKNGDVDALHSIAGSLDDRLAGAKIWHFLADGPSSHVPSAFSLGKTYDGTGRADASMQALRYYLLAAGETKDGPIEGAKMHQGALLGAASVFQQKTYLSTAMDYLKRCVNADGEDVDVTEEGTKACKEAFDALAKKIMAKPLQGGVNALVEMFPHASLDGFPSADSDEAFMWSSAVKALNDYRALLEINAKEGNYMDQTAEMALVATAEEQLEDLKDAAGNGKGAGMSELQQYLVEGILLRAYAIVKNTKGDDHDEL